MNALKWIVTGAICLGAFAMDANAQDTCATATVVGVPSSTPGTTVGATLDVAGACGTAGIPSAAGVWFSVTGTGNLMTASLCGGAPVFDTQISVFTAGCGVLTCVDGNNDFCGLQSETGWCSTLGQEYLVLVHGVGVAEGAFTLDVTDNTCDDSDACTVDSCVTGVVASCSNVDTTPVGDCCNPVTGTLTAIDDANACTDDTCLPTGAVLNTPNALPCDDLDVCTVSDVCSLGVCSGAPNALCTPTVSLVADVGVLPVSSCYSVGDLITIRVEMGASAIEIVGGQFFLEYDTSRLDFVSMVPGDLPFTLEVFESVDEVNGLIDYAVGVQQLDPGTLAATTMAVITFEAIAECDPFVQFRENQPPTKLTDATGAERLPILSDLPQISINGTAPVLSCPGDIVVNADAGSITSVVGWTEVTASDSCDGMIPVTCTSSPTTGLGTGGTFPPGLTSVTCTATNACGIQGSCTFDVTVTSFNEMVVDIELSPTIVQGPLERCITFTLQRCGVSTAEVQLAIDFGGVFSVSGMAEDISVLIPAGAWECLMARDELHTLRSSAEDFREDGTIYRASFIGNPDLGGHWLVGGNLNDDEFIDISDFAIYNSQFGPSFADVDCSVAGPHGDVNGDGLVTLFDFSFVQQNFLDGAQPDCCSPPPSPLGAGGSGPRTSISV